MAKDMTVIHLGLSPKGAEVVKSALQEGIDSGYFHPKTEVPILADSIAHIDEQLPKKAKKKVKK